MYDSIATLKGEPTVTYDTYGNEVIVYQDREVYVTPRGVYQSEFYNAAQAGLHPSLTLEMANRADYKGEKLVKFEGIIYDIIRVDWTAQRDKIALICQERVGKYVAPTTASTSSTSSQNQLGSELGAGNNG